MQIIQLKNAKFNKENIKELLSKKTCIIGVFSKSCIHCQIMKPEWNNLKNKLKKINTNSIFLEIDSDQLNYLDYSILTNSIKGFPAIMVFKNGKLKKEYNGKRTANDMFKFFKSYMSNVNNKKTLKTNNVYKRKNVSKKIKYKN